MISAINCIPSKPLLSNPAYSFRTHQSKQVPPGNMQKLIGIPTPIDDENYRLIHVTPKTKVQECAELCLNLLAEEADQRPLCLLSLPLPGTSIQDIEQIITLSKVNPDKNSVGRVISIAEIVKRRFSTKYEEESINNTNKSSYKHLHQYNQYGALESLITELSKTSSSVLSESEKKAHLLAHQEKILKEFLNEERKRPRQTHTPWLKIYLSKKRIPSLENDLDIFYQKPPTNEEASTDNLDSLPQTSVAKTAANPESDGQSSSEIAPV